MASDPHLPIQKAIYDALTGDATLMNLISGVYDFVPQGTAFPYVTIGEDTLSDWGSHTFDGADSTVTLHSWAQGASRKAVKEVMAEIYRILHKGTISVTGFSVVLIRFEFSEASLDPDGQTYHGIQRFRLLVGGN